MFSFSNSFLLIVGGQDSGFGDPIFSTGPVLEEGPSGSGHPTPSCLLDMNFGVSGIEANRIGIILLTLDYCINKTYGTNITDFNYIDYLNRDFKIVKVDGKDEKPSYGKIEIKGKLNISEHKTKNWTLETSIDLEKGPILLFDSNRRKIGSIEGKSKQKNIRIQPKIKYFFPNNTQIRGTNIKIYIINNQPRINENETKVVVSGPQIGDEKKLIYWDPNNPLVVNQFVSANDVEDNNKLQYIWTLEYENDSGAEFITNSSNSREKWRLKSGENYTFKVKAKDLEGSYSETIVANIFGKDNTTNYEYISVPSWKFYSSNLFTILILSILVLLILFIIKFKFKIDDLKNLVNYLTNFCHNSLGKALISIVVITLIFILLFHYKIKFWHIYSISLAFYELYIFIILFIIFGYLAEDIFFKNEKSSSKYIWLTNNIIMIFILVSFYGVSSGITQNIDEHLSNYYTNITQVSGTLLGLILGFYLAKFDHTECKRSESYLKTLEYLVLLYGTIIGLSLWGLSSGATIYFTPLIEFNLANMANIFSIWVFESTLLLVPLAITSLYRLIKEAN